MTSIGTLFAFIIVCAGVVVLRKTHPGLEARLPGALGALHPSGGNLGLPRHDGIARDRYLDQARGMACCGNGDLFRLQPHAQQGGAHGCDAKEVTKANRGVWPLRLSLAPSWRVVGVETVVAFVFFHIDDFAVCADVDGAAIGKPEDWRRSRQKGSWFEWASIVLCPVGC